MTDRRRQFRTNYPNSPLGYVQGYDHDRHYADDDNGHGHGSHEHDCDGIMMPMTISVTRVKAGGMPATGALDPAGVVVATVQVHVPTISCRARIEMTFVAPAGSNRADWAEIAYERALMMLDPA